MSRRTALSLIITLFLAFGGSLLPTPARAQAPFTAPSIIPSADAFMTPGPTGNLAGNNYGGAGAEAISASDLSNGQFDTVMQFNLSSIKTALDAQFGVNLWSVQSVTLTLTATAPNNGIFNASAAGQFSIVWMQDNTWTEGTGTPASPTTNGITFTSLPTYLGSDDESAGTFSHNGATSGTDTYTLTLPAGFVAEIEDGGTASFHLDAADTQVSALFDSRSFNTAADRPQLSVTAVPEPSPGILLLGSTMGLAFRRHRRIPCAESTLASR